MPIINIFDSIVHKKKLFAGSTTDPPPIWWRRVSTIFSTGSMIGRGILWAGQNKERLNVSYHRSEVAVSRSLFTFNCLVTYTNQKQKNSVLLGKNKGRNQFCGSRSPWNCIGFIPLDPNSYWECGFGSRSKDIDQN
jgi:hypothetical protein